MRPFSVFLLLAFALGCGQTDPKASAKKLQGAGSSFVNPMMQEWAAAYYKDKGVAVNYQSLGSGAGIRMATAKEVDIGCTDAPLNNEQLEAAKEKGGDMLHIPL